MSAMITISRIQGAWCAKADIYDGRVSWGRTPEAALESLADLLESLSEWHKKESEDAAAFAAEARRMVTDYEE